MSYDFQTLKSFLRDYVATNLVPSLKAGKDFYICPLCDSGTGYNGTGAFHLIKDNWQCFACNEKGDLVDLHSKIKKIPLPDAAKELSEKYAEGFFSFPVTAQQKSKVPSQETVKRDFSPWFEKLKKTPLTSNQQAVAYLQAHGIQAEQITDEILLLDETNIRSWDRSWGNAPQIPALIFPYSTRDYWHARELKQGGTWKKPSHKIAGEDPLYGSENLPSEGPLLLVEGMSDAVVLKLHGQEVLCLSGVSGYRRAAEILSQKAYSNLQIVEALDLDERGRDTSKKLVGQLDREIFSLWNSLTDREGIKDVGDLAARSPHKLSVLLDKITTPEDLLAGESVGAGLDLFLESIQAQDESTVLSTGFSNLDEALDGGLHTGLYILGAVSSIGKTTLALQIADNIAASKHRDVLFVSLEQGQHELISKSLSGLTRALAGGPGGALSSRYILTHKNWSKWTSKQSDTFQEAVALYTEMSQSLWIKDGIGDIGVGQIRSQVKRHAALTGRAPVVVVDYLQILAPVDSRASDKMNTDRAVTELKRLSRDFQTPVLAISSLNRMSYSRPVSMESFKESGAIEYGSDVLLGLQIKGLKESEDSSTNNRKMIDSVKGQDKREMELKVLKNRNGKTGGVVSLTFEARFSHFEESNTSSVPAPASKKSF